MKKLFTKGRIALLVIFSVLIIDQIIKIWIKTHMYWHESIRVTDWFYIYFTENNGMAFGMEIFGKLFLTTFRIVAVGLIGYYLYKIIKKGFKTGYIVCVALILTGALGNIIDSVFYVTDTPSIDSLDNVGIFIQRAFTNLYGKRATIVDKFVAFNLLVTKFEAYLKKLYYLMKGHEVPAQNPGEDVTWKNVIYAHKCLWNLKYSTDEGKQQLYQYLMLIKGWRNSESHISPTASEQEVDTAISIILTMYFYATGSSITDLEMNGHEIQKSESVHKENSYFHKVIQLHPYYNEENDDQQLVAEANVKDWPEEKRIATLKKSICQLIGYEPKRSPLSKQRHWIAIYRIAADKGFIIEGDFAYFKRIIDDMQISNLPVPLKIELLQSSIKDVYAKDIEDWTDDNLSGKKLAEYEDIKKCADAFAKIVGNNINTK